MACSISAVTDPLIWSITSKAQASQSHLLQELIVGNVFPIPLGHAIQIFKLIVQRLLLVCFHSLHRDLRQRLGKRWSMHLGP